MRLRTIDNIMFKFDVGNCNFLLVRCAGWVSGRHKGPLDRALVSNTLFSVLVVEYSESENEYNE
jgi:hypothetical protein